MEHAEIIARLDADIAKLIQMNSFETARTAEMLAVFKRYVNSVAGNPKTFEIFMKDLELIEGE